MDPRIGGSELPQRLPADLGLRPATLVPIHDVAPNLLEWWQSHETLPTEVIPWEKPELSIIPGIQGGTPQFEVSFKITNKNILAIYSYLYSYIMLYIAHRP